MIFFDNLLLHSVFLESNENYRQKLTVKTIAATLVDIDLKLQIQTFLLRLTQVENEKSSVITPDIELKI